MKIVVCLKQVPSADSAIKIDSGLGWIKEEGVDFETNEPDTYALEMGLRLKEQYGGEVVAISVGPQRAEKTVKESLAKGADRGILVLSENMRLLSSNSLETARILAAAIKKDGGCDMILTGLQSSDTGSGQTGINLAAVLNLPSATMVLEIAVVDGGIRVKQELEAGWFRHTEMPLPAVLMIQSGTMKVRYITLMGIKNAKKKPMVCFKPEELGMDLASASNQGNWNIYVPQKSKQTHFLSGSPAEAVKALVGKLRKEARVI